MPGDSYRQRSQARHSPQSHKELDMTNSAKHRCKIFSRLWQLRPKGDDAWMWHSCLDCGNSGSTKCAGTPAVSAAELLLEPFSILWQLAIRGLLWLILLCCLAHSRTYTFPRLGFFLSPHVRHLQDAPVGVLFCFSVHQALKAPSWWKSFSVAQCIRCLKGHPL